MSDQWLSIVEYARKFNISDMTVRRRIKTGKLQAVLREGKYYIPLDSIAAQHRPSPVSQPVVKARPAAHAANHPSHHEPVTSFAPPRPSSMQTSFVPHHINAQLRDSSQSSRSMVDVNTLLAFCEGALKKFSDAEIRLEQQYQQKIAQLEALLKAKETESNQLSQQVEDLQVLVKILERKAGKLD